MTDTTRDLASMRQWAMAMHRLDQVRCRTGPKRTWLQVIADRLPLV